MRINIWFVSKKNANKLRLIHYASKSTHSTSIQCVFTSEKARECERITTATHNNNIYESWLWMYSHKFSIYVRSYVAISIYQRYLHISHICWMQTFAIGNLTRIFDFDWLLLVKEFFRSMRELRTPPPFSFLPLQPIEISDTFIHIMAIILHPYEYYHNDHLICPQIYGENSACSK